jgi:hypothetical protein
VLGLNLSLDSDYPEVCLSRNADYPEVSLSWASDYPEVCLSRDADYPEVSLSRDSDYPEVSLSRDSNGGRSTSSGFPNSPRPKLPASNSNSSHQQTPRCEETSNYSCREYNPARLVRTDLTFQAYCHLCIGILTSFENC